jgi:hypothetical protein
VILVYSRVEGSGRGCAVFPCIRSVCLRSLDQGAFFTFPVFFGRVLKEMVLRVAQFLVAPTVRFNAAAIFTNGSLPAILLRRARSSGDHERLVPDFFVVFAFFGIIEIS